MAEKKNTIKTETLLLEIGAEEIPAGYIEPALAALSLKLSEKLDEARIEYGERELFGTPRRLAIKVSDVAVKQKPLFTEIMGPSVRVAYDEHGEPTRAAEKFAEKVGFPVNRLTIKETDKGRYLCAGKSDRGLVTKTVLKRILPDLFLSLPFPKTMKWGELTIAFARPLHSILALLGGSVISFTVGSIRSGRYTYGHPFMNPRRIKVSSPEEYLNQLSAAHVVADMRVRRRRIETNIAEAAEGVGGRVLPDEELLNIVKNLVEFPVPSVGRFEEKFLELPKEVLVTAMREHQKYFAVINDTGDLLPFFIAVNNTRAKDMTLVAKGHERVLRARLEDARFFFTGDLAVSLDARVERLKGVLFQARLGTMYEKALRLQKLSAFMADRLGLAEAARKQALRAALLCKTDLVSHIVGEFPKLQGIMGRIYAAFSGEDAGVSMAVEEHYQPTYSGGPLPETPLGAIVGIADKVDSICGCFAVRLVPTGATDPYALRRQGVGILQTMYKHDIHVSLTSLIQESLRLFDQKGDSELHDLTGQVYRFIKQRLSHLLAEEGYAKDVIAAVIDVSIDHVPHVWNRVRALESMKGHPDFIPLVTGFKRVWNIIKKSGPDQAKTESTSVNTRMFEHESEAALYQAYVLVKEKVASAVACGRFDQAMIDIASLRSAVDAFFDDVMVMVEDDAMRDNRLTLLRRIAGLFNSLADFSKISAG